MMSQPMNCHCRLSLQTDQPQKSATVFLVTAKKPVNPQEHDDLKTIDCGNHDDRDDRDLSRSSRHDDNQVDL
jgi:hypothetical protein